MRIFVLASLVAVLIVGSAGVASADTPPCGEDFNVGAGRFYSQTGGGTGLGYNIYDDESAQFWTAFTSMGGISVLGYPVSERFEWRGFQVQAFQKAVLQWDPSKNGVNVANLLDTMYETGMDGWLGTARFVPPHQALPEDTGADWPTVVQNHLRILEANPEVRDAFLAIPQWQTRLGLPIAYSDFGAVRVLRAQRAVLQQWTNDTPWSRAGQVIFANVGDMAKDVGMFPAEVIAPVAARVPTDLAGLIALDPATPRPGDSVEITINAGHANSSLTWATTALPLVCQGGAWHSLVGLPSTL